MIRETAYHHWIDVFAQNKYGFRNQYPVTFHEIKIHAYRKLTVKNYWIIAFQYELFISHPWNMIGCSINIR